MIVTIFLLIAGFIFLIKGADFFVTGASSAGLKLKVPQIVIGLTIVALGTSLPELFINITGSLAENNDIVLGNIVGSNIFNTLMILGTASIIYPVTAGRKSVWMEIPFVILVSIILLILSNDQLFGEKISVISRGDGIILFLFLGYFIYYLYNLSNSVETESDIVIREISNSGLVFNILIGITGLIIGGNIVVDSAVKIAEFLNLSDKLIALSIIAIGTGLPELVTSVVAAIKKNSSIALGNIVGSNIFNILLVVGTSSIIFPIKYSSEVYLFDYIILIFSAIILFSSMVVWKKNKITRLQGFIMVLLYAVYLTYNIIKA